MARKKTDSAKRFTVKSVEMLAAAFLVTLDSASLIRDVNKAFVRIRPDTMSDEEVEQMRAKCIEGGAVAVRVLPRRSAQVLTTPKSAVKTRSIRDVILQMVKEANTTDRDALTAVAERVMAEAGL